MQFQSPAQAFVVSPDNRMVISPPADQSTVPTSGIRSEPTSQFAFADPTQQEPEGEAMKEDQGVQHMTPEMAARYAYITEHIRAYNQVRMKRTQFTPEFDLCTPSVSSEDEDPTPDQRIGRSAIDRLRDPFLESSAPSGKEAEIPRKEPSVIQLSDDDEDMDATNHIMKTFKRPFNPFFDISPTAVAKGDEKKEDRIGKDGRYKDTAVFEENEPIDSADVEQMPDHDVVMPEDDEPASRGEQFNVDIDDALMKELWPIEKVMWSTKKLKEVEQSHKDPDVEEEAARGRYPDRDMPSTSKKPQYENPVELIDLAEDEPEDNEERYPCIVNEDTSEITPQIHKNKLAAKVILEVIKIKIFIEIRRFCTSILLKLGIVFCC